MKFILFKLQLKWLEWPIISYRNNKKSYHISLYSYQLKSILQLKRKQNKSLSLFIPEKKI